MIYVYMLLLIMDFDVKYIFYILLINKSIEIIPIKIILCTQITSHISMLIKSVMK